MSEGSSNGVMSEAMLEGIHIPDTAEPTSPEADLWCAVLARVWADAFEASDVWLKNSDRGCEPGMVRAEARRWLLLDHGEWKSDREEICCAAGVDPDAIHAAAVRRNKLAVTEDVERIRLEREAIDRAMTNLAANEHRMERGRVNRSLRELADREMCL